MINRLLRYLTFKFGQRRIIARSILVRSPVDARTRNIRIRDNFTNPGVQALLQAMEEEAGFHQYFTLDPATIARGSAATTYHAGGASSLLQVLSVVDELITPRKMQPEENERETEMSA